MTALIKGWLRCGVMEEGQHRTTTAGTPQGGVVSPLLANLVARPSSPDAFQSSVLEGARRPQAAGLRAVAEDREADEGGRERGSVGTVAG